MYAEIDLHVINDYKNNVIVEYIGNTCTLWYTIGTIIIPPCHAWPSYQPRHSNYTTVVRHADCVI